MNKSLVVFDLFICKHNQINVLPLTLYVDEWVAGPRSVLLLNWARALNGDVASPKYGTKKKTKLLETVLLELIHENRNKHLNLAVIFSFC